MHRKLSPKHNHIILCQSTILLLPLLEFIDRPLHNHKPLENVTHLYFIILEKPSPGQFKPLSYSVSSISSNRQPPHLSHNLPRIGISQPKLLESKGDLIRERSISREQYRTIIKDNPRYVMHKVSRMPLNPA